MLTSNGLLTDIGSWYLGGNETGNIPEPAVSSASTATKTAGGLAAATSTWCCVPTSGAMGRSNVKGNLGILSVLVTIIVL